MRVAVTYDLNSEEVFQHFGQTHHFLLADKLEDDSISFMVVDNGGFSHSDLVSYLSHLEVNLLICGGLGYHAIELLNNAGIEVIPGITGPAKEAVTTYFKEGLKGNMSALHNCDHHHN